MKAFPRPKTHKQHNGAVDEASQGGMELRDYFAAKAMQGMLAAEGEANGYWSVNEKSQNMLCDNAYNIADAMLKAREA